jgi:hypothetical protein
VQIAHANLPAHHVQRARAEDALERVQAPR